MKNALASLVAVSFSLLCASGVDAAQTSKNTGGSSGAEKCSAAITRYLESPKTDAETGGEVTYLQKILVANGYRLTDPFGFFGSSTVAAVTKFQVDSRITPQTGTVGPITRAKINALPCSGVSSGGLPTTTPSIASVMEPSLLITSQADNEKWRLGQPQTITWEHSNVKGKITIALFGATGGSCVIGKAAVEKGQVTLKMPKSLKCSNTGERIAPGTYLVSAYVPVTDAKGTYYLNASSRGEVEVATVRVKVKKKQNSDNSAASYPGGPFAFVTSQSTDETWDIGSTHQVTWEHRYPDLSGGVTVMLSNMESAASRAIHCGLGQASLADQQLTVSLTADTQCWQGGTIGNITSGAYWVVLQDGGISPGVKAGYGNVSSTGRVLVPVE